MHIPHFERCSGLYKESEEIVFKSLPAEAHCQHRNALKRGTTILFTHSECINYHTSAGTGTHVKKEASEADRSEEQSI